MRGRGGRREWGREEGKKEEADMLGAWKKGRKREREEKVNINKIKSSHQKKKKIVRFFR